jgi:hypothetical protein
MIRNLLMAAALMAAAPVAAFAQPAATGSVGGVVVEGQPRNAYVMRVTTAGKDNATIRQEIWSTAWTACNRAPRTGNTLETRPNQTQWCAMEAASNALRQFDAMAQARKTGAFVDVAAGGY